MHLQFILNQATLCMNPDRTMWTTNDHDDVPSHINLASWLIVDWKRSRSGNRSILYRILAKWQPISLILGQLVSSNPLTYHHQRVKLEILDHHEYIEQKCPTFTKPHSLDSLPLLLKQKSSYAWTLKKSDHHKNTNIYANTHNVIRSQVIL